MFSSRISGTTKIFPPFPFAIYICHLHILRLGFILHIYAQHHIACLYVPRNPTIACLSHCSATLQWNNRKLSLAARSGYCQKVNFSCVSLSASQEVIFTAVFVICLMSYVCTQALFVPAQKSTIKNTSICAFAIAFTIGKVLYVYVCSKHRRLACLRHNRKLSRTSLEGETAVLL